MRVTRRHWLYLALLLLFLVLAFAIFCVLQESYFIRFKPEAIEFGPKPGESFAAKVRSFTFLVTVFVVVVVGVLAFCIGFLKGKNQAGVASQSPDWNGSGQERDLITETIATTVKEKWIELTFLFALSAATLVLVAVSLEDYYSGKQPLYAPTVLGLSAALISIGFTVLAMHYAFQAEKKSQVALKNTDRLIDEKAVFLNDFEQFVRRIVRVLHEKRDDVDMGGRKRYAIKAMFLTPFLGHAGITHENLELHELTRRLRSELLWLVASPFCEVKLITLKGEELVDWYRQVAWVEMSKNMKREQINVELDVVGWWHKIRKKENSRGVRRPEAPQIPRNIRMANYVAACEYVLKHKIDGHLELVKEGEAVPSFEDLARDFYRPTSEEGPANALDVRGVSTIPFQCLIVRELDVRDEIRHRSDSTVILSFVGSETYKLVIKSIVSGHSVLKGGGVEQLLRSLHSAYYSEGAGTVEIVEKHFDQLWRSARHLDLLELASSKDWKSNRTGKGVPWLEVDDGNGSS